MYFSQNGTYLAPISGKSSSSIGFNENATLPFVPGKTYRLRVINTSAFSAFFFWIDGHDMRIIEADGVKLSFVLLTEIPALISAARLTLRNPQSICSV